MRMMIRFERDASCTMETRHCVHVYLFDTLLSHLMRSRPGIRAFPIIGGLSNTNECRTAIFHNAVS